MNAKTGAGTSDFAEALTMLARLPGLTDAERAEAVRQLLAAQSRRDDHPGKP